MFAKTNYKLVYNLIIYVFLFFFFISCNKIKRKENEIVTKTFIKVVDVKAKILKRKDHFVDKIFPAYDGMPDTKNNKMRFKEHLLVDVSDDVKNIVAHGDFIGVDYKVLITFTCNTYTLNKIVKAMGMALSNKKNDEGLLFPEEFPWWDKNIISTITPYKGGRELVFSKYLWYNPKTSIAYYEEFSL